mgnify:CR=1 FL=1
MAISKYILKKSRRQAAVKIVSTDANTINITYADVKYADQTIPNATAATFGFALHQPIFSNQDLDLVKKLIENHFTYTSSKIAEKFLNNWKKESENFVKIMPTEYKLALEKMAKEKITEIIK